MSEINQISNIDRKITYSTGNASTGNVKKADSAVDFSSFLGESKGMDEIFDEAADKYQVPVELLKAVGKTESNFNANAVSRCGAQGVMQLMPATARELGVTDSFNAKQNIMAGAKYLSGLLKKYDGDSRLALAAYNAGSGNVAKYNGVPPFEETQNYVKKVMNYMGQGNLQVAEAGDTNTTSGNLASQVIPMNRVLSPTATPIQRNLSGILANSTPASADSTDLDSLFTYDDYMKFLELFLEDNDPKNAEKQTSDYGTGEINYNTPVMNLLNNQNLY